jgi:hypothetical protein
MQKKPHLWDRGAPPSFRVGCKVFARYFLVVCSTDSDLHLFWIARTVNDPNPDSGHFNAIQL